MPAEDEEAYMYNQIPELKAGNQGKGKLALYLQVIDLSFISDARVIYKDGWSNYYIKASEESRYMNSDLRALQIGETHSMVSTISGKIFAWGYNDHGQLFSQEKNDIYHTFKLLENNKTNFNSRNNKAQK